MKCDTCSATIPAGDEREHHGRTICEDCYMDSLSTVRSCDPWAAHSAKNCEKLVSDGPQFTEKQSEILAILKSEGPMAPEELLRKMDGDLPMTDLERDFATLHHMGKVGAKKQEQGKLWLLT